MNSLGESCLSPCRNLKPFCREELCQSHPDDSPARKGDSLKQPLLQGDSASWLCPAGWGLPHSCPPEALPTHILWDEQARELGASMSPAAPLAQHRSCSLSLKHSHPGEAAEVYLRGSEVSCTEGAPAPCAATRASRPGSGSQCVGGT